jgi:hypothetical protein
MKHLLKNRQDGRRHNVQLGVLELSSEVGAGQPGRPRRISPATRLVEFADHPPGTRGELTYVAVAYADADCRVGAYLSPDGVDS